MTAPLPPADVNQGDTGHLLAHEQIVAAVAELQTGSVQSADIDSVVALTQAAYDALAVKDPWVLYLVTD